MSNEQLITVIYQDRVAIVTLNRPEKLNALNQDLYYLLAERLREIDQREDIFITVLTGTGRFFSAYVSQLTAKQPQPQPIDRYNKLTSPTNPQRRRRNQFPTKRRPKRHWPP